MFARKKKKQTTFSRIMRAVRIAAIACLAINLSTVYGSREVELKEANAFSVENENLDTIEASPQVEAAVDSEKVAKATQLEEEEEEVEIPEEYQDYVYIAEVMLVIILSIAFDMGKESLDEKLEKAEREDLMAMIDVVFKEITILGFIGLLVYICAKTDVAQDLAEVIIGPTATAEALQESFELVHMVLFAVMVIFCIQAAACVYKAGVLQDRWKKFEKLEIKGDGLNSEGEISLVNQFVRDGYMDRTGKSLKPIYYEKDPRKLFWMEDDISHMIMWRCIRHSFLQPYGCHDTPGAVAKDGTFKIPDAGLFNFAGYLSKMMAELFETTVEIDTATWLVACIVAPLLVPVISADGFSRSGIMLVMSLLLTYAWYQLALVIFQIYINCTFDPKMYPALTDPAQTVGIFTQERRTLGVSTSPQAKRQSEPNIGFSMPPVDLGEAASNGNEGKGNGNGHGGVDVSALKTAENARSASQAARMHMLGQDDDKPQYKQQNDSYGQVNNKELSQQLINAPANPTAAWSQPNAKIDDSKLARNVFHSSTINEANFQVPNADEEVAIKALFRTRPYTIQDLQVSWWQKWICDPDAIPDMHELAFPLRREGPTYIKWALQVLMFFQAIYMSGIVVSVLTNGPQWTSVQWFICACCLLGPYCTLSYTLPQAISRFAIITSIEHMKNQHLIHHMVQDAKKERLNNIVQLLQLVKLKGRVEQYQGGSLTDAEFKERLKDFENIPEVRQNEIINVFDDFDTTNDGTISRDEMEDVLKVLGFDGESAAAESAMLLMKFVNRDDGTEHVEEPELDLEEFKVLMVLALMKRSPEESREDGERLFEMFDEDGGGTVDLDEFVRKLDNLGCPVSRQDVVAYLYECFQTQVHELDKDHFCRWLEYMEDKIRAEEEDEQEGESGLSEATETEEEDELEQEDEYRRSEKA